jgi:hypothetical protein
MPASRLIATFAAVLGAQLALGCSSQGASGYITEKPRNYPTDSVATTAHRAGVLQNLYGPESVRYASDQDVYFVSVMNGFGSEKDNNGYIVQVAGANLGESKLLVVGGKNGVTLDAPKGLAIHGDTLWTADIDKLRAFNRYSGKPMGEIDLAPKGAVLLNDVAVGPDGTIYTTDTGILMSQIGVIYVGGDKIFSIGPNRSISVVAHGNVLGRPNGVTWDPTGKRWVVVSFDPFHSEVYALHPSDSTRIILAKGKGKFDGIEPLPNGTFLVSSWADSSIHQFGRGEDIQVVRNVPTPADIGLDTKRFRVAIPTGGNRVEFWDLAGK